MNNEYLWSKSGNDPEIEKLETALAPLRYREALPPRPTSNEVAVGERQPRWRITWTAFAFAASVAAISIAWAVWPLRPVGENGFSTVPDLVFVSGAESPMLNVPAEPTAPDTHISVPPARRERRRISPTTASGVRRIKAKDAAPNDSVATLSDEEKYAYRQLMLALSITGSKLKIVKDTIDGTENTDDNAIKNQR